MKFGKWLSALALAAAIVPGLANAAVTEQDFYVKTTADLAKLCGTEPSDPLYSAAIHFCHGVGVGFVRYHESLTEGKGFVPLFCFPETVTRTQALNQYVSYSKAHPEYDKESVGDVVIKFFIETYPCKAN